MGYEHHQAFALGNPDLYTEEEREGILDEIRKEVGPGDVVILKSLPTYRMRILCNDIVRRGAIYKYDFN